MWWSNFGLSGWHLMVYLSTHQTWLSLNPLSLLMTFGANMLILKSSFSCQKKTVFYSLRIKLLLLINLSKVKCYL